MSEYGSGTTLGKMASLNKERIIHALRGELLAGEDGCGFVYEPAPREECDRYVLTAYDNAVYHMLQAAASGRAYERLLRSRGISTEDIFPEWSVLFMEECERYSDYAFEVDVEEFMDELDGNE